MLKVMQQQVGKMYMAGIILRNIYVCVSGTQTCEYFECPPPTLEHYMSQGRRLPRDEEFLQPLQSPHLNDIERDNINAVVESIVRRGNAILQGLNHKGLAH